MRKKAPRIIGQSGYLAKVLIIDELGLPPHEIVDPLLQSGCLVYLVTKVEKGGQDLDRLSNFYLIGRKDLKTLSNIDNLIVIGSSVGDRFEVGDYPEAYRTAVIFRHQNTIPPVALGTTQLICYEDIVGNNLNSKYHHLLALAEEGNRLLTNSRAAYYPINSICIGNTIKKIVNREIRENNFCLTASTHSWPLLLSRINQNNPKVRHGQMVEIPEFTPPEGWPTVSCGIEVNLETKLPLLMGEDIPDVSPKKISFPFSRIARFFRSLVPRKLFSIHHHAWGSIPRFLVLLVLVVVNLILFGHVYLEKKVNFGLSAYRQSLSNLSEGDGEVDLFVLKQQANDFVRWQKKPLSLFLSTKTKQKLPSLLFSEKLLAFVVSYQEQISSEHYLARQWFTGHKITPSSWEDYKSSLLQSTEWLSNALDYLGADLVDTNNDLEKQIDDIIIKQNKRLEFVSLWQTLASKEVNRFLVLVQNNYEIRPTGGLVSAYGLLTFGLNTKPTVEYLDSTVLDTRMVGHVQPPQELTNQLGENTWYFRDINWDPDFSLSAERAIWYYENSNKTLVDGVIATDSRFWLNLGNWLTPDEAQSEDSFFDELVASSSNQKGTYSAGLFLSEHANQTFSRLVKQYVPQVVEDKIDRPISGSSIFDLIYNLAEAKDLAFYVKDPSVQKILATLGWDGKIKKYTPPVSAEKISTDYLMLNESNTGINLTNRYVNREVSQHVVVTKNQRQSQTIITYRNNSYLVSWPGGVYQAYVRLFLPSSVSLRSVVEVNKKGEKAIEPTQINGSQFDDKAVFGWRIEVGPGDQTQYVISYTDKGLSSLEKIDTYLLMVQKQLGMDPYDFTLTLETDDGLVPLRSIPSGVVTGGVVSLTTKIVTDKVFQIDLGR